MFRVHRVRAFTLWARLASLVSRAKTPSPSLSRARLASVIEVMRSELPVASCSLEHLARIARMEPFDFLVAFRRATGATPDQHLVNLRLDRSRDLLSTTDMSVPDIVRRVGFEDDEHYVRLFTTRERCSPQRLRSSSEGRAVTATTS